MFGQAFFRKTGWMKDEWKRPPAGRFLYAFYMEDKQAYSTVETTIKQFISVEDTGF